MPDITKKKQTTTGTGSARKKALEETKKRLEAKKSIAEAFEADGYTPDKPNTYVRDTKVGTTPIIGAGQYADSTGKRNQFSFSEQQRRANERTARTNYMTAAQQKASSTADKTVPSMAFQMLRQMLSKPSTFAQNGSARKDINQWYGDNTRTNNGFQSFSKPDTLYKARQTPLIAPEVLTENERKAREGYLSPTAKTDAFGNLIDKRTDINSLRESVSAPIQTREEDQKQSKAADYMDERALAAQQKAAIKEAQAGRSPEEQIVRFLGGTGRAAQNSIYNYGSNILNSIDALNHKTDQMYGMSGTKVERDKLDKAFKNISERAQQDIDNGNISAQWAQTVDTGVRMGIDATVTAATAGLFSGATAATSGNRIANAVLDAVQNPAFYTSYVQEFGSDYADYVNNGVDEDKAVLIAGTIALLNSYVEVQGGTEKSINSVVDRITKKIPKSAPFDTFKEIFTNSLEEALEEIIQAPIGNLGTKLAYNPDQVVFDPAEQLRNGWSAFISSLILGGAATGIEYGVNRSWKNQDISSQYAYIGQQVKKDNKTLSDLLAQAETSNSVSARFQSYTIQQALANGETPSDYKVGQLAAAMAEAEQIDAERQKIVGERQAKQEQKRQKKNQSQQTEETPVQQETDAVISAPLDEEVMPESGTETETVTNPETVSQAARADENTASIQAIQEPETQAAPEESAAVTPSVATSVATPVSTSETQEQPLEISARELSSYGENGQRALRAGLTRAAQNGESQTAYKNAFTAYYKWGTWGKDISQIDSAFSGSISQSAAYAAYMSGVNDNAAIVARNTANQSKATGTGGLMQGTHNSKVDANTRNYLDALGRAFRVSIAIDDEGSGYNGMLDKNGVVHIAADTTRPAAGVLNHELTHVLRSRSESDYQTYKNVVAAFINKESEGAFEQRVEELIDLYAENGQTLTRDESEEEIVANASEMFLRDKESVNLMVKQNRGVAKKILDAIRLIINKLKGIVRDGRIHNKEAQILSRDMEAFQRAERLWVSALSESTGEMNEEASVNEKTASTKEAETVKWQLTEDNSSVDERMLRFIQRTLNGDFNGKKWSFLIGKVSEKAAQSIENVTGIDVSDYEHRISPDAVIHIEKRHGANGEHDNSMAKSADIAQIPYILNNFSNIEIVKDRDGNVALSRKYRDKNNQNAPMIRMELPIKNNKFYVVEAVPDTKAHTLWVVSAYAEQIKEEGNEQELEWRKNSQQLTSETSAASLQPSSTFRIVKKQGFVNSQKAQTKEKFSLKETDWHTVMTEEEASEYNRLEGELNSISEKIRETGNRLQELKSSDEYKEYAKTAKGTGRFARLADEDVQKYPVLGKIRELRNVQREQRSQANQLYEDQYRIELAAKKRDEAVKAEQPTVTYSENSEEADARRKQVLEKFGTTKDWNETGYILKGGEQLNFRGGAEYGHRSVDHREVAEFFGEEGITPSEAMVDFINEGNIRTMPETPGMTIAMGTTISDAQEKSLSRYISRKGNDYFLVDIVNANGDNLDTLSYERNARPEKVISDIRYYLEHGEKREESVTAQFHSKYQLREDEPDSKLFSRKEFVEIAKDDVVQEIISDMEYENYGIRIQEEDTESIGEVMEHTSSNFGGDFDSEELSDIAGSLDGVSAIDVHNVRMVTKFGGYEGKVAYLLGSDDYDIGYDGGEIIMKDPVVLAKLEYRNGKLVVSESTSSDEKLQLREDNPYDWLDDVDEDYPDEDTAPAPGDEDAPPETVIKEDLGGDWLDRQVDRTISSNENVESTIAALRAEGKAFKDVKPESVSNIVKAAAKQYGAADTAQLNAAVHGALDYLARHGEEGTESAVASVYQAVKSALGKAESVDRTMYDETKGMRDYLKTTRIYVPDSVKSDITDYNDFRKSLFGKVRIVNDPDAMHIDQAYAELSAQYPGLLSSDIINPSAQLQEIADTLDAAQPVIVASYGEEGQTSFIGNINEAAIDMTTDILHSLAQTAITQAKDADTRKKLAAQRKRFSEQKKKLRQELRNKYKTELISQQTEAKAQAALAQTNFGIEMAQKQKELDSVQAQLNQTEKNLARAKKQAEKDALKARMTDYRNRMKALNKWLDEHHARQDDVARLSKRLNEQKAKAQERIASIREANRLSKEKAADKRAIAKRRQSVEKITTRLYRKLSNPTDTQHIPQGFRVSVANFLSSLDFEGRDKAGNVKDTKVNDAWRKLAQECRRIASAEAINADSTYLTIDPDLADRLDELSKTPVRSMNKEQIEELYKAARAIEKAVIDADQVRVNGQMRQATDVARGIIDENRSKAKETRRILSGLQGMEKFFKYDLLDPTRFADMWGDGFKTVYSDLRSAELEKIRLWAQFEKDTEKMMKDSGYSKKKAWKSEKTIHRITLDSGKKIELSSAQIMEIYLLNNREQGRSHLYGGGITPGSIKNKGVVTENRASYRLTEQDVKKMIELLSADEKKMADQMGQYASTTMSGWGNKASMELYGYKKFTESNYWPISTDSAWTHSDVSAETAGRTGDSASIKDLGMTKAVVQNASNPIMVGSVFDTFSKHATQMAAYSAYLNPIENLNKVLNWQTRHDGNWRSVRESIRMVGGQNAISYLNTFIRDVNGQVRTEQNPYSQLMGRAKAAAIAGNLRVVVQQPTAWGRAAAIIPPQYMIGGLVGKVDTKGMRQYAPIAQWKDWGYFRDGTTGANMKQLMLGKNSVADNVTDKAMALAGIMDDATWKRLYRSVELWVAHDMGENHSEAYRQEVGRRFTDVIDRTQVVDSVFERTQAMRSTNYGWQIATAFMAEPLKTYNLLVGTARGIANAEKSDKGAAVKTFLKAAIGFGIQAVLNAAAQSLWDIGRDKDDDETWEEKFLQAMFGDEVVEAVRTGEPLSGTPTEIVSSALGGNLQGNLNVLNLIPVFKDVMSWLDGYDTELIGISDVKSIIEMGGSLYKSMTGDPQKKTTSYQAIQLLRKISSVTGLPIGNIYREVESGVNLATTLYAQYGGDSKKATELRFRFDKYYLTGSENRKIYYSLIYKARQEGNEELAMEIANWMIDQGVTRKSIDTALQKMINDDAENSDLINEYADAYNSGNIAKMSSIIDKAKKRGISGDELQTSAKKLLNTSRSSEDDEEEKDYYTDGFGGDAEYDNTYLYDQLADDLLSGNESGADEITAELKKSGKEQKDIDSGVKSKIKARMLKDAGYESQEDMEAAGGEFDVDSKEYKYLHDTYSWTQYNSYSLADAALAGDSEKISRILKDAVGQTNTSGNVWTEESLKESAIRYSLQKEFNEIYENGGGDESKWRPYVKAMQALGKSWDDILKSYHKSTAYKELTGKK